MVTGDHPLTATSVAVKTGIIDQNDLDQPNNTIHYSNSSNNNNNNKNNTKNKKGKKGEEVWGVFYNVSRFNLESSNDRFPSYL